MLYGGALPGLEQDDHQHCELDQQHDRRNGRHCLDRLDQKPDAVGLPAGLPLLPCRSDGLYMDVLLERLLEAVTPRLVAAGERCDRRGFVLAACH